MIDSKFTGKQKEAFDLAYGILETQREPFLVLDKDLRIVTANGAFYRDFQTDRQATEGRLLGELGDGHWNIPRLHSVLKEVLTRNQTFQDFEVEFASETSGSRRMLLDGRRIPMPDSNCDRILLAIEDISGRERAEDTAALLAQIVASSSDAIISKTLDGVISSWNKGAERIFGYTAEEAVGKSVKMLIPPDRIDEEPMILSRIRQGESVQHYETVRQRKDGRAINISLSVSPLHDGTGRVIGASKVARDITDQKAAEEQLRRNAETFSKLVDQSPFGIYTVDSQFRITQVSAGAQPIFRNVRPLIGRDFAEAVRIIWPEPFAMEVISIFRHTLETGEAYVAPSLTEHRRDEAVVESYEWEVHRIPLPDGQNGLVCYFFDSTRLRQAEHALRESEVRYRRLFESAQDGILLLDPVTRRIIDANSFMTRLTGLELPDLLGKELHEVGMASGADAMKAAFEELQRSGYLRFEHLSVKNARGEPMRCEIVANIYHEGDLLVAQANIRDITERLAMEDKIKQQAETLELESRRKDEFLAMLSHELRNPLAPIRSAVHLLKLAEKGSENLVQLQAREIIERQVANLTKLVGDLLEVSRVVSGRIHLNRQAVDVNQVIQHAIETVTPLIEQHHHTLSLHLCGQPVWAHADATRMEEVFINLLNNAAKYTPDGGHIEVSCEQPAGSGQVQVRIRDNGIGIDPALLPYVFDLFTQADRSLERSAGGLGIGLSLAHRIVALHEGGIEAHSPPPGSEVGTEFTVRLALAVAPASSPQEEEPNLDLNPHGCRVLVVDDNIDLVMALASTLRHRGYSVQSAYTGPDGLKVALRWRPDVVLLDIGLPGLDGYEVARRLRSESAAWETHSPKIIAITGYGREADIDLAREVGFDAHVVKPYDFEALEHLMLNSADS